MPYESTDAELTIDEAAILLNVSRPYVETLLDRGEIPFHHVGTNRRIFVADLREFERRDSVERARAATELTEEAQNLALGY